MAHEIQEKDNMIYVGERPWHGIGTPFIVPPTLDDAIVAAKLNWTVKTAPLFTAANEKVEALVTRRSDDNAILGVVGPNYHPLQNSDAFKFFEPFIDSKEAFIETAGSLNNGKRVWVLCKINRDPLVIKGDDTVEKFIMLSNSHDGTMAVRVGFTPIRVVCNNTLTAAHNSQASSLLRVKHTKSVNQNLEKVREIMNLANQQFEASAEQYRVLASREINSKDLEKYVKLVFNQKATEEKSLEEINSRVLNKIIPLFEKGRGNDMAEIKGTYWAAYNAVTEYLQYERGDSNESRFDSVWFGSGAQISKKALEVGLVMANVA
jgi:phage/plasmid-like protein (TIGR03299 family)